MTTPHLLATATVLLAICAILLFEIFLEIRRARRGLGAAVAKMDGIELVRAAEQVADPQPVNTDVTAVGRYTGLSRGEA